MNMNSLACSAHQIGRRRCPPRRLRQRRLHGVEQPPQSPAVRELLPARPFPSSISLDEIRRDIGKSQSIWTDSKMETAGSPHPTTTRRRR
jgi:hypothetical protein